MPASTLFVLKQALQADGTPLGDIIPLMQVHALADLVPRFSTKADEQLMKQNSLVYSTEFWLNKYFNKDSYFALTLS